MPPVVYAIGYVVGWAATIAYEYGIYLAYAASVVVSRNQAKKAERRANLRELSALAAQDRTQMFRAPLAPWRAVYGMTRLSGAMTFIETTGSNRYLHIVVTLTSHEVAGIEDVYLDDDRADIDANGNVLGRYNGYVKIFKGLGSTAGDAAFNAALSAAVGAKWTANHKQTGCAKLYVQLSWNRNLFSGIPNISAVVRGKKLYDPRIATTAFTNNAALCLRDYVLDAEVGIGATTGELDDPNWIAAANICDEEVSRAAEATTLSVLELVPGAPTAGFSSKDKGAGFPIPTTVTYKLTFVTASGESLPGTASNTFSALYTRVAVTLPTYSGQDYVVTARKLYRSNNGGAYGLVTTVNDNSTKTFIDPGSTLGVAPPATPTYAIADALTVANGARHYRTGDSVTLSTTGTLPAPLAPATQYFIIYDRDDRIKLATSLSNAQNSVAIDITTVGTGTHTLTRTSERRFTCDGLVEYSLKPSDILGQMLTSVAGSMVHSNGKWKLLPGVYRNPTLTIDESILDGPIKVTTRVARRDLFNAVKGVILNPADFWQPVDFPPYQSATYKAEDNNELIWHDIELPFTLSPAQAQRIAKMELERARQQITVQYPCKLIALQIQVGDVVNVTNARFGWSAKPFEVVEFKLAPRGGDVPSFGVDLMLRETAAAVYDWNNGLETLTDPAPNTNLPNPFVIAAPANVVVTSGTSELYLRSDGTVFSRIKVTWSASTDEFVKVGGRFDVQFKPGLATVWQDAATVPGDQNVAYVLDVQDGADYDVQVRTVNSIGVTSDWAIANHTVVGKTAPPADVATFSASQNGQVVVLLWSQVPDADLAGYEIRYDVETATWEDATQLTSVTRGTQVTTAAVPTGTWKFFIKARDTSGNYSTNAKTAVATVSTALDIISQREQAPDWLGTRTGLVKHWTGVLIPDDQNIVSVSYNNFEWCDTFVPTPVAVGYYEAPEVDIGFDDSVRISGPIASALGPGVVTGTATPTLEIDYRLAAGAYDGFEFWNIGERTGRYFKHRLKLDTAVGKAKITGFLPTLDQLEDIASVTGAVVAAGGSVLTFPILFHNPPHVEATPVSGSALFATIASVTAAGFTANVWNTAGTSVGGTINYTATGV